MRMYGWILRMAWLVVAFFAVSCSFNRTAVSTTSSSCHPASYEAVTNAINCGDWNTLRRLAKPGMGANEWITMWENSKRSGHGVRVGKLVNVERDAEYNGKRCTKYSFALENEDGTANPRWLQILVQEHAGKSELLDFWNFGW